MAKDDGAPSRAERPYAPPSGIVASLLPGMVRSDRMGRYDLLGRLLRRHSPLCPAPTIDARRLATLSHLRSRYLEARSIEARHGTGSLLNLDDPDVMTLIRLDRHVSPDEVGAAVKFRAKYGNFCRRWVEDAARVDVTPSIQADWVPISRWPV